MRAIAWTVMVLSGVTIRADDWKPLFNGRDLSGWKERGVSRSGQGRWRVVQGILTAEPGQGWLASEQSFGDFVLRVEWRISQHGNSGLFFRVPEEEFSGSPSEAGFEIQILDDRSPKYQGRLKDYQYCGGLYHFVGIKKSLFQGADRWQSYELSVRGDDISLTFNGEPALSFRISDHAAAARRPKKGQIGLQNHGARVEFRSIVIRSLD